MNKEIAFFGGGCFWCTEAVFQKIHGVSTVTSGYMGGSVDNPTYKDICTGTTGHAELVKIEFDPSVISFEQLLNVFWATHDPTTLNRQGNDKGTQYRSVIFYNNDDQKESAINSIENTASKLWEDAIVTQIVPKEKFYPAEDYHQNYYTRNSFAGYCQIVISPKLSKLRKSFSHLIK